jgi:hypothetical protein
MIIYYVDGKKFVTKIYDDIPWLDISSPDENTPAYENKITGDRVWCMINLIRHRLTGPARMYSDGTEEFYLNGKCYENVKDWLKDHPNPNLYFHNIGVFTETDKVLWFLQN